MTLDISNLTKKELIALRRKVDSAIEKWDAEKLSKARREAKQLANSYGLKLEDLLGEAPAQASKKPSPKQKKKARGKVAPKYRNPANARETWTGRGRQPKWVAACLASGQSLSDLAI